MYAANEDPIPGIDTAFVVRLLEDNGHRVAFVEDQNDIVAHLDGRVREGDQVIFFGGDDFFQMADAWAARRRADAE
jgi:UDP-N-acetylmuramate--alanine ligase